MGEACPELARIPPAPPTGLAPPTGPSHRPGACPALPAGSGADLRGCGQCAALDPGPGARRTGEGRKAGCLSGPMLSVRVSGGLRALWMRGEGVLVLVLATPSHPHAAAVCLRTGPEVWASSSACPQEPPQDVLGEWGRQGCHLLLCQATTSSEAPGLGRGDLLPPPGRREGGAAWHHQLALSWSGKEAAGSCSQDSPLLADLSEEGTAGR